MSERESDIRWCLVEPKTCNGEIHSRPTVADMLEFIESELKNKKIRDIWNEETDGRMIAGFPRLEKLLQDKRVK